MTSASNLLARQPHPDGPDSRGRRRPRRSFGQEILLKLIHGVASWLTGHRMTLARVGCSYRRPSNASEYGFLYPGPVFSSRRFQPSTSEAAQLATPIRQDRRSLTSSWPGPRRLAVRRLRAAPDPAEVREHLRPRLSLPD